MEGTHSGFRQEVVVDMRVGGSEAQRSRNGSQEPAHACNLSTWEAEEEAVSSKPAWETQRDCGREGDRQAGRQAGTGNSKEGYNSCRKAPTLGKRNRREMYRRP